MARLSGIWKLPSAAGHSASMRSASLLHHASDAWPGGGMTVPQGRVRRRCTFGSGVSGRGSLLRCIFSGGGGVPAQALRFAAGLGHAFDYYDGLSFEVRSRALGPERPVAAGGRYDGLLARLGGPEQSRAVGCMVRPWRAFAQGEA